MLIVGKQKVLTHPLFNRFPLIFPSELRKISMTENSFKGDSFGESEIFLF